MNQSTQMPQILPSNQVNLMQALLLSNLGSTQLPAQQGFHPFLNQQVSSPAISSTNLRSEKPQVMQENTRNEEKKDDTISGKIEETEDTNSDYKQKSQNKVLLQPHELGSTPIIPQVSNMSVTSNPLRAFNQMYYYLQLASLLRAKQLQSARPIPYQNQNSPIFHNQEAETKDSLNVKVEEESNTLETPEIPKVTPIRTSKRIFKAKKPKHLESPVIRVKKAKKWSRPKKFQEEESGSTTPSDKSSKFSITQPALVEFTKDFPDWGLSDIFLYLSTGQPRKDLTPSRKSNRPVQRSVSHDQDKSNLSSEEEIRVIKYCIQEIKSLLEMNDIVESKVRLMLKKNEMKSDRVLGTVKKNLPFYKRYFSVLRE